MLRCRFRFQAILVFPNNPPTLQRLTVIGARQPLGALNLTLRQVFALHADSRLDGHAHEQYHPGDDKTSLDGCHEVIPRSSWMQRTREAADPVTFAGGSGSVGRSATQVT